MFVNESMKRRSFVPMNMALSNDRGSLQALITPPATKTERCGTISHGQQARSTLGRTYQYRYPA